MPGMEGQPAFKASAITCVEAAHNMVVNLMLTMRLLVVALLQDAPPSTGKHTSFAFTLEAKKYHRRSTTVRQISLKFFWIRANCPYFLPTWQTMSTEAACCSKFPRWKRNRRIVTFQTTTWWRNCWRAGSQPNRSSKWCKRKKQTIGLIGLISLQCQSHYRPRYCTNEIEVYSLFFFCSYWMALHL